jgi:tape measure domain-containing protein
MAAQDAELQLKVSLDLAFFKQQLAGLGQAAAGYNIPINVKFDRRSVQDELNALSANIRRRNYRLNIETNLSAEIAKADTLARKLEELSGKIKSSAGSAFSGGPQGAAGLERFMREQGLTGKAFGVQQSQERIARQAVLDRLNKGSLSKGGYNTPGLVRIIESLGGVVAKGASRNDLVGQAKKLIEESNNIADSVFDSLKDLQMKLRPLRGQAQIGASRSASNINKILDPIARLTQNPRAAQTMLRMLPESRITTNLLGKATQQAQYYEQVPSARSAQGLIKGFDPLLRAIADDFTSYTKSLQPGNPWLGKIGNGIVDVIAKSVPSASAQKLLPAAGQTSASRMTRQMFAGLPPIQAPSIGQENAPLSRAASYMVTKARRALGLPIGPSSPLGSMGQFPMSGMMMPGHRIPTGGGFAAGGGSFIPTGGPPSPPPGGPPGPPAGGGAGGSMGGFGRRGAGPSTPFATPLGSGYFAVGKGLQSINTAYQQVKPFLQQNRVPLSGAIAELGGEFGNAIKQVLLFGTAYKALAFLTSLPGEAFNAAKGLATYKNQLEAVTSETNTFDQSLAFVDSLATRFNVPLESARQGFVKLYASMQPAGFSQQQIEGLFTGISQATAAFGLSADKVDRVNYAFAQMASKGQIMSEELKGQLGDVLPGALALFAEAAQMSIPEFGQAMEDGAFKGKAMEQVLSNVAILMTSKFGPAAQGASKTLQGALNQMQNNLKLMYESFTPVVNGFAAAFGPQVNQLIKDVTSTVSALTGTFQKAGEGYSALTPRAQSFYSAVQSIVPSLKQASSAVAELGGKFASLLPIVVQATAAAISFAASPIGRSALIAAVAISGLTATFKLLEVTGIKAATKAVYTFIGGLLAIPQATGVARLGVIALKLAVTGLFVGGILLGLDYLTGKLLSVGDAANNSAKDVRGMRSELDALAGAGDIQETAKQYLKANTDLAIARKNNAKALADVRNAELAVNSSEDPRSALAAVTAAKLNAEKTYAKVLEAQRAVQAARQSRDNAVSVSLQQEVKTQKDLEKIDLQKEEKGSTSKKSLDALVNEDLLLAAETAKAQTKLAAQQSIAMAPDTMQSKRMIAFNSEIRDIFIEIATINAQIDAIDKKKPELIELGYKAEEISAKKKELNNQLTVRSIELLTAEVQYRNKAKDDAIEEKKQRDEKIKDQLEINRLLEDAAILAGAITPQQAAIRKQRREFDDQMLQLQERDATPEQLSALAAYQAATPQTGSLQESLRTLREEMDKLVSTQEMVKTSASSIGEAFSSAFRDAITGASSAQEALSGFFTNVANSFADMVSEMISKWLQAQLIQGFMSLFPGMGSFTGGASIGQSVSLPSATGIGAGGGILQNAGGQGFGTFGPNFGIRQFANGGVVSGPTLGLIGEGRFNEAVIPMPDGKSVPVDLGGAAGNNISTNIVVNVNNGQVQGGSTSEGSADLGRKMEGAVKQVLVNELRPGGLLSGGRR